MIHMDVSVTFANYTKIRSAFCSDVEIERNPNPRNASSFIFSGLFLHNIISLLTCHHWPSPCGLLAVTPVMNQRRPTTSTTQALLSSPRSKSATNWLGPPLDTGKKIGIEMGVRATTCIKSDWCINIRYKKKQARQKQLMAVNKS